MQISIHKLQFPTLNMVLLVKTRENKSTFKFFVVSKCASLRNSDMLSNRQNISLSRIPIRNFCFRGIIFQLLNGFSHIFSINHISQRVIFDFISNNLRGTPPPPQLRYILRVPDSLTGVLMPRSLGQPFSDLPQTTYHIRCT